MDSWSTTFAQPSMDADMGGSNDAVLHKFEEANGFTELHFSRPLEATDDWDYPISEGEEVKIIFAWHDTSDALTYHGFESRGKASIGGSGEEEPAAPPAMILGGSLELGDGAYSLSWEVDQPSDGGEVQMVHVVQKTTGTGELQCCALFSAALSMVISHLSTLSGVASPGWIGLGIAGAAGGMVGADIIISSMGPGGECVVEDYWSDSFVAPTKDTDKGGANDISDVTCSRADGSTEFSFSRPVSTSDSNDHE